MGTHPCSGKAKLHPVLFSVSKLLLVTFSVAFPSDPPNPDAWGGGCFRKRPSSSNISSSICQLLLLLLGPIVPWLPGYRFPVDPVIHWTGLHTSTHDFSFQIPKLDGACCVMDNAGEKCMASVGMVWNPLHSNRRVKESVGIRPHTQRSTFNHPSLVHVNACPRVCPAACARCLGISPSNGFSLQWTSIPMYRGCGRTPEPLQTPLVGERMPPMRSGEWRVVWVGGGSWVQQLHNPPWSINFHTPPML